MNFVAIDFETANEARNSACALGLATVKDGEIETDFWLIRPPTLYFNPFNVHVHGLTADDVERMPRFDKIWPDVKPLLEGRTLVAHCAGFDMSVLRHVLDEYGLAYPELSYYCTHALAKRVWPSLTHYGLDSLAAHIGVRFDHHDAEEDAMVCAHLALQCCRERNVDSLVALAEAVAVTAGTLYPGGYTACSARRSPSSGSDPDPC
jgi:DNA polymerase-3 subunit epsilon